MKDKRSKESKPNIIIIMADDMGIGDLGCYNTDSQIPTPNMDRLAAEGMMFMDAHSASSVCTPSRYGLLTGSYCWRGDLKREVLFGYEPMLIDKNKETIATMLKKTGYNTACVGKWHIGMGFAVKEGEVLDFEKPLPWKNATREEEEKIDFPKGITEGPLDVGFDYFYGNAGCPTCQPPYAFIEGDQFVEDPSYYHDNPYFYSRKGMMAKSWQHKEVDLIFTEKAVGYIASQKDKEAPFFLYLASNACHEPCVEEVVLEFARGKSKAGHRGDLVWLFDWMVGQVIDEIEKTDQIDNTIIMVTSDNGALPGDRFPDYVGQIENYETYGHKANGNFKGYKSHIWEGGHREPLIVKWPNHIEPGTKSSQLLCLTDLMATCAGIVGADLGFDAAVDSFNMLPVMVDQVSEPIRKDIIHHSCSGTFSLRRDKWKLVIDTLGSGGWPPPTDMDSPTPNTKGQLYDIEADVGETKTLYDDYPGVVAELKALVEKYKNEGRSNGDTEVL